MPYTPSTGTLSNKPYSITTASPTDGRTYFYDTTNFLWRPFQSTAEVLAYLDTGIKRNGHYAIVVNPTGTLGSDGTFTGGKYLEYWFRDGVADGNLVEKLPLATSSVPGIITIGSNLNVTNGVVDFPGITNGAFTTIVKNINGGPYQVNSTVPYISGYQWGLAGRYTLATILNNASGINTDLSHTHDANHIVAGVFASARLGTGTANSSTILYGDGTFKDAPEGTTSIAYTTLIPFNHKLTRIAGHTITADTAFTPNTTGAIADSFAVQTIVTGGHTMTFPGMNRIGPTGALSGAEYEITYRYDGTRYFYEPKLISATE